MEPARKVTDEISIIPSYFPIPGFGLIPVNAFVLKAQQPVLVDTGLNMERDEFMTNLKSVIDPAEIRWLYLTHPDQDHVGSLKQLMDENPRIKLITTFIGYGVLGLSIQIPLDRIYLLNPGESLDLGDRQIVVMKPPTFDNPGTTGFLETKNRALFTSDFFGGLVQKPAEAAEDYDAAELRQGQVLWSRIDAPWVHSVDQAKFATQLKQVGELKPSTILSSHLPPATRLMDTFLETIASAPNAPVFVGPNQPALEMMLKQMTQGTPA
jgi:flavorubredoxin